MKAITKNISLTLIMLTGMYTVTFSNLKRIAVLHIETNKANIDPQVAAQLVRYNLEKRDSLQVISNDEMNAVLKEKNLNVLYFSTDESKFAAGEALNADLLLLGNIVLKGKKSIVSFKLFDVKNRMEANRVFKTFHDNTKNVERFIQESLDELLNSKQKVELPLTDAKPHNNVTEENTESIKGPEYEKVNLGGPRIGYTFLTGEMAKLFKAPVRDGGYDCTPAFFQFGYQFEACYVSHGHMQGLFEFIPTITGMDQSKVFPSLTMLNGFRNTRFGIEVALGPTIYIRREARGYYDANAQWHLQSEWNPNMVDANGNPYFLVNPNEIISRTDSRGDAKLASGVVIALGKTFRSGNLNLPVNAYVVPGKSGWRFGISAGFNLRNSKKGFSSVTY